MKKIFFISFLLIGTLFSFGQEVSTTKENVGKHKTLSVKKFSKAIKANEDVQLIDVRTPAEFDSISIDNAININFLADDFEEKVEELDKSKPVYLYCKGGGRSLKASQKLLDLGFVEVYDLKKGITNWNKKSKQK